jgi:signal transduction histidine kinase
MTLANRVSAFFLVALAIALVSYSTVFYFLMRNYLYQQFDNELQSALHVLTASVELDPDDVQWDPTEHGIDRRQRMLSDAVWIVCDDRNQVIDGSPHVKRSDPIYEPIIRYARQSHLNTDNSVDVGQWRILQKEIAAPMPKSHAKREPGDFASVRVTVARSQTHLAHAMNRLALLVSVLPAMVWLIAAIIGRWFVRHALSPVRSMAVSARSMTHADFGLRLPIGQSQDELAELGRAFNCLLDQLQFAFDRQRRFTGDAAHQLRNPLTVLQGQLDVARRRRRSAAEYEQTLDVLIAQTAELRQTVESLLFLARSDGGATIAHSEIVALDEWLPKYMAHFDGHPRRKDIIVCCESQTQVLVSVPLFSQLLDNLLSNALKYSQAGTPVKLVVKRENDRVVLAVQDQGIGISRQDHKSVFEPFFRSEEARRGGYPGSGLGLSVAARIATVLKAELWLNSTPGQCSTFTVSLRSVPATDRLACEHPVARPI